MAKLITTLLVWFVLYCVAVFGTMELNPADWPGLVRWPFAFAAVIWLVVVLAADAGDRYAGE